MSDFGKVLILFGTVLLVVGIIAVLLGRTNLPLGRLPGDFLYRGKNTTVYFPLATSLLISVVLSLVLHVIGREIAIVIPHVRDLTEQRRRGCGARGRGSRPRAPIAPTRLRRKI